MAKDNKGRGKRPQVQSRHGVFRFQTGMITSNLLQRGLQMEDAFKVSRELRRRVSDRELISADEIEGLIQELLAEYGLAMHPPGFMQADGRPPLPMVRTASDVRPFPRHVVMRDLVATGLDTDAAAGLLRDLDRQLRALGDEPISEGVVDEAITALVEERCAVFEARRYRLVKWLRTVNQPVVIFIGGATGTGKTTLAMELAFRLGIPLATSTDVIRETMRSVISPQLVPGLHDHSFRGILQVGQVLSDPEERVLAGFRQQSAQVAVGVRAAIARAHREQAHMIIEGTHLLPPFDQYLPPNTNLIAAGFVLNVQRKSVHRDRFPVRALKQTQRDASTYLESFQSVRWIHDYLLSLAEDAEAVVLASTEGDDAVVGALDYLCQALPSAQHGLGIRPAPTAIDRAPGIKTLFLVIDGLPDEPHPGLGNQTPLAAARTPYLRMLAGSGGQGQVITTPPGEEPETNVGLWSLFGVGERPGGRGLWEAIGLGHVVRPSGVLFRGNVATVADAGRLIDRRAGRISKGVGQLLAGLRDVELSGGLRGSILPGHEHRVVVQIYGSGLSAAVSDTDPGSHVPNPRVLEAFPTDETPEAARTAGALRELLEIASRELMGHAINVERYAAGELQANCIITRGVSAAGDLPKTLYSPDRSAMVAGCPTALGLGRMVGMRVATSPAMTANVDTDLDEKFQTAASLLEDLPFVAVHIKGTDIASHDRAPFVKRDFLSSLDAALGRFLMNHPALTEGMRVVVAADHGTSSLTGNHIHDPVPLLVATWHGPGEETDFDETSAPHGALGLLQPGDLVELLWTM